MAEKKKAKKYGKIVKLPKNSNANSFMENIKIPRNKLWYVLVEKQDENDDTELHMVKYNQEGVDATQFVAQLKEFYMNSATDDKTKLLFESIRVVGNDKFSVIKNVPDIEVEGGKKLISKITTDLIRLLK